MSDVQTRIGIAPVVVGGGGARNELAALWQEFKNGKLSVEEFNAEMRNTSGAIYAQRRVVMLLRTEYRNQRAALYEAMRGFRAVARIGRTITSTYMTYTLMQTRVADRARDVRDTQEDLVKIQERRIRVVSDLGATNAIALRLIDEEGRLTARLTEEKRGLKQAQDQNIVGYVGIGLQVLQVVPSLVSLQRHISLTRTYIEAEWGVTGLANIATAAAAAEVSILGVKTTYGTLVSLMAIPLIIKVGWDVLQDLADKVNEQLEEAGLPVTEKKPGDPGMIPIWPGVWLDEDLLDEYPDVKPGVPGIGDPRYPGGVEPEPDYLEGLIDPVTGEPYPPGVDPNQPDIVHIVTEGDVEVEVDVIVKKVGFGGGGGGSRVR